VTARLIEPNACTWCDIGQREHLQRWTRSAGWHTWAAPTDEQRLERMLARRVRRTTS
jgi:hypothetical protein